MGLRPTFLVRKDVCLEVPERETDKDGPRTTVNKRQNGRGVGWGEKQKQEGFSYVEFDLVS